MYPKDKYFFDRNFMIDIVNNLRFLNFTTDFIAETKRRFLTIYIQSFPPIKSPDDSNMKKIIYLALFLISCFHEILGHLFLRMHNYLDNNNQIQSPPSINNTLYEKEGGKGLSKYIDELIFGNYKFKMTIKQILFILDKNNYSVDHNDFRNNFNTKCVNVM